MTVVLALIMGRENAVSQCSAAAVTTYRFARSQKLGACHHLSQLQHRLPIPSRAFDFQMLFEKIIRHLAFAIAIHAIEINVFPIDREDIM